MNERTSKAVNLTWAGLGEEGGEGNHGSQDSGLTSTFKLGEGSELLFDLSVCVAAVLVVVVVVGVVKGLPLASGRYLPHASHKKVIVMVDCGDVIIIITSAM